MSTAKKTERFAQSGWRVVEIVDTRSVDMMTGKPEPGTGEVVPCDCCGRDIMVHAAVYHRESGDRAVIGTECCRQLRLNNGSYSPNNSNYWRRPNKRFATK